MCRAPHSSSSSTPSSDRSEFEGASSNPASIGTVSTTCASRSFSCCNVRAKHKALLRVLTAVFEQPPRFCRRDVSQAACPLTNMSPNPSVNGLFTSSAFTTTAASSFNHLVTLSTSVTFVQPHVCSSVPSNISASSFEANVINADMVSSLTSVPTLCKWWCWSANQQCPYLTAHTQLCHVTSSSTHLGFEIQIRRIPGRM